MRDSAVFKWLTWLKDEVFTGGAVVITKPGLNLAAECLLRFILGLFLSDAVVLDGFRPFALGLLAASGGELEGFCALLGVSVGYLALGGVTVGLKYVAIAILIYAVHFILRELDITERVWFSPAAGGLMTAIVGLVFLADSGFTPTGVFVLMLEILAVSGITFLLEPLAGYISGSRSSGAPSPTRRMLALFALGAGLLITFTKLQISGISPARALGGLAILLAGGNGGFAIGAAMGLGLGAAMDLASAAAPFYTVSFGIAGLAAGLLRGEKRIYPSLCFVIVNALCVIWFGSLTSANTVIAPLIEAFAASLFYMLVPHDALPKALSALPSDVKTDKLSMVAARRLNDLASAFSDLYESLASVMTDSRTNDNEVATVFDRTADKICRKCIMRSQCWDRDYNETFSALNDAAPAMIQKGQAEAGDFPIYFSSKCRMFDKFVIAVNNELSGLVYRRRYKNRLGESRRIVCGQYNYISTTLRGFADTISAEPTLNPRLLRKVEKYLTISGLGGSAVVYTDRLGRLTAEMRGLDRTMLTDMDEMRARFEKMLGTKLGKPARGSGPLGETVIFREIEPYEAIAGIASKARENEVVNGDSGICFTGEDGRMNVILSDGMGSGPEAAKDSRRAVRLLEKLIKAGTAPEIAMNTLDAAFILRGDEGCGFATIDLLQINLFTGRAEVYKWGAAPTYVKADGNVACIGSGGAPPGTGVNMAEHLSFNMSQGDFAVICSDGVADRDDDAWLKSVIAAYTGDSPKELAERIITVAEQRHGAEDDMTVVAVMNRTVEI